MRFLTKLAASMLALVLSTSALAQGKVAVVDLNAAIMETDVAKMRIQELQAQADVQDVITQAETLMADIRTLQEEAQANSVTWSAERLQEQQAAIQSKSVDFQAAQTKLNDAQNRVVGALMQELRPRAGQAVQDLIQSEGIGLLLDKSAVYPVGRQQGAPIVLYVDTSFDLTPRVTEKLNQG
ncbi:OmpH family outer membrane protein [Umboniibacter marinipuniceus]|uniref:Periplasmic chaperone for outer membrane proteins Skp n=1 Tax=Umboniibacter marinipuniceus TaxID=569599 RepID=A0A3M0A0M8_9GAMM|nr:OmpH family outer membrane protein [Umboniibacter marinipuniceus]RMA78681.1 periplasmic chaperone for outer membrane proteins Skp [Umboniibacter marinipuniceus]